MRSLRSESLLVLPLFPIFLAGAFPFLLMGLLGFAGIGILGALMMSAALTVALDADTEFNAQSSAARVAGRVESGIQSATRDAMVRFAKAVGLAGAALVVVAVAGLAIYG
jgi:hypothetical protein